MSSTTTTTPLNLAAFPAATAVNAEASIHAAIHLMATIDSPDINKFFLGSIEFEARPFPLFSAAYRAALDKAGLLTNMSRRDRLLLKLALLRDVNAHVKLSLQEAAAPKLLNGVSMPTEPAKCLKLIAALTVDAEQDRDDVNSRLVALDVAKCMAERMAANLAAAALFSEDRFTVLPPLTFKEAKECIERDPKRARLSLSD